MQNQPPQAYIDAYWAEVAGELERVHQAPPSEIPAAVAKFRQHTTSGRQTIYNRSPMSVANAIVGHGSFPSVPAVGLGLKLVFQLTDSNKVLDDPMAVVVRYKSFFSELNSRERSLGGQGFVLDRAESLPGLVTISLRPVNLIGVAKRLMRLSEELEITGQRMSHVNDLSEQNRQLFTNELKVTACIQYQSENDRLSNVSSHVSILDNLICPAPRSMTFTARFGKNGLNSENLLKSEITKDIVAKELMRVWEAVNELNMAKGQGVINVR